MKSCFLCKLCSADWLQAVGSNKQNLHFKKGQQIFEEGSAAKGIYFLHQGIVKVHKRWGGDKQLILRFAKQGDMIGYRGLGNDKHYPVAATALQDSIVCFVSMQFFEETLKANHQLTYTLLQFYTNELQAAEQRMRNLAHMEVKGRVAEMLLMLERDFGQDNMGCINILLSRQDMASYSGTTYETFFRVTNDLVKEGILQVSGKKIGVKRSDLLQQLTKTF